MANQSFTRPQNPTERAARALINPNESHECKTCGSSFFTVHNAELITMSAYAIRSVSVAPQQYYSCVGCGDIFVSGNMQNMANKGGEREAFLNSLELAKEYKASNTPTELIKNSASITEVEDLRAEVERLEGIVLSLIQLMNNEEETEEEAEEETEAEPEQPVEKITRKQKKSE